MSTSERDGSGRPPENVGPPQNKRQRRRRTPPPASVPNAPLASAAAPGSAQPIKKRVDGRGKSAASRANLKRGGNAQTLTNLRASATAAIAAMSMEPAATPSVAAARHPANSDCRRQRPTSIGPDAAPPAAAAAVVFGAGDDDVVHDDFILPDLGGHGLGPPEGLGEGNDGPLAPDWELYRDALDQSDLVISPIDDEYYAVPLWDSKQKRLLQSTGYGNSGKRVVVLYLRQGKMTCNGKGCRSECEHIRLARDWATQLGYLDARGEPADVHGADAGNGDYVLDTADAAEGATRRTQRAEAISHAIRGPPVFCRLEDDERDRANPTISSDLRHLPSVLRLSASSRCRCGRTWGDATPEEKEGVDERTAFVFGETEAVNAVIETAACSTCRSGHCRFGPDLVDVGLFNWNNSILFTREVFDSFLIEGHLSEKTFRAYVVGINFKYQQYRVLQQFPKRDCFASAFFAYSKLLQLSTAPHCPECGDQPDIVICDGSGISFPSKYLRGRLRGPPFPTSSSVRKEAVRLGMPLEAFPGNESGLSSTEQRVLRDRVTAMTRERLRGSDLWTTREMALLRKMATNGTALARAVSEFAQELPSLPRNGLLAAILLLRQVLSPDMVFYLVPVETFDEIEHYTTTGEVTANVARL
ncbi:hypothetical protein JCM3774_005703 [Rhodotorula dairenensis]